MAPDSTIDRVAIPWLHVIREHPVFLANYADLFESDKIRRVVSGRLYPVIRNMAWWFRQLLRALRHDGKLFYTSGEHPDNIDLLFVSHLLNVSQAGKKDDFYFNGLPEEMAMRGYSVAILLINHTNQSPSQLLNKWKGGSVTRVILSNSLGIVEEILFIQRMSAEARRLKKHTEKADSIFKRAVLNRSSIEALSGGALTNLRIASQINMLITRLRPKAIMITHEGHSWERVVFAVARSVLPSIKCLGYQHAALFRLQHAIRRNLAREYNPDEILSSGTVGKVQLEQTPGLKGIPVTVLGSNRSFKEPEFKGDHPMTPGSSEYSVNYACLVLPEGIVSECHVLFEFSLACAIANPEIKFIWRLHPLVTFKYLLSQNPKLRYPPKNIVLSQATLEEDIACCRWALYRGTTAVIQAVIAGLRPIYLQLPGEMTIDPLYDIEGWRVKLDNILDFQRVLEKDFITSVAISSSEMQSTKRYCEEFFLPLDFSSIEHIISDLV